MMKPHSQSQNRQSPFLHPHWWQYEGLNELLCDRLSDVFDLTPIADDANLGLCRGKTWTIDGHVISQAHTDATILHRSKSQAENRGDVVYVHRYLYGNTYGFAYGTNFDKRAREVYLTDQSMHFELVQSPLLTQGIFLPKPLLGYDRALHDPFVRFSDNPGTSDLLNAEMDRLFTKLFWDPENAPEAFYRFVSCLKSALGTADDDMDVRSQARSAIRDRILAFLEAHLTAPGLSVDMVLKNFGVSRASLYRMFEDKGGVRQYISDRRLFRAVAEICRAPLRRGDVNAAAMRWGFSSSPSFNRAVKHRFGVTPGSLTNTRANAPQKLTQADQVSDFFNHRFHTDALLL